MSHPQTTNATILQAAQQMHDAADKLHGLLRLAGAVNSRFLLQAMGQARRVADDLQQFAADLESDQRDTMRSRIMGATSRAELDAIALDLEGLAVVDAEDPAGDPTSLEDARALLLDAIDA